MEPTDEEEYTNNHAAITVHYFDNRTVYWVANDISSIMLEEDDFYDLAELMHEYFIANSNTTSVWDKVKEHSWTFVGIVIGLIAALAILLS